MRRVSKYPVPPLSGPGCDTFRISMPAGADVVGLRPPSAYDKGPYSLFVYAMVDDSTKEQEERIVVVTQGDCEHYRSKSGRSWEFVSRTGAFVGGRIIGVTVQVSAPI